MYIKKIKIKGFRNIVNCNIEADSKINFIYGKNAQGKTNLLETIYFSSLFKSFRTNKNTDLINDKEEMFFISIEVINNKVSNHLKISLDKKNTKKIIINNKRPDNKLYKILNSIIYYPDEISYLKFYPSYRRNLIDRSIFYINNEYINIYKNYVKCLKQRNIFLKTKNYEYDIWKDQLIEYGYSIIKERINYINKINNYLEDISFKNNLNEEYRIKYNNYEINNIKDNLVDNFKKNELKEINYGYTLVGPHIDDFIFLVNNKNMNRFSSEGQKKSLLLSYKQAQLSDYKDLYNYYPILLFDDIGNELDSSRKKNIFEKLIDNSGQIFVTTTEIKDINTTKNKTFEVKEGEFSEFIFN